MPRRLDNSETASNSMEKKKPNWLSLWAHLQPYSSQQAEARMFPRDAATGSRRAASMYDDYYDYDYGHGLEAVRQAAQAIPLPPAYGTKAKVHIGYGVSLLNCIIYTP